MSAISPNPQESAQGTPLRRAHVIVVGNEKGGSGKTTTTMHLIVALLRLGFTVGSLDIDSRQRSLTRYVENRRQTIANEGVALPVPTHFVIQKSPFDSMEEAKADEKERFAKGLAKIYGTCDFVVIDTPGNDTYLSRLAHSFASTVITPINDSFVDLDVLAAVDGATLNIVKPSIYAEMVWEQKLARAKRDGGSIDWIVMRNRLSNLDARNKRFMAQVTEELARRIGFRVAPGFSERVIFREMFLQGLTVLDVLASEGGAESKLSISHVAARQEVRNLLAVLKIPEIDRRIEALRTGEITVPPTDASTPAVATEPAEAAPSAPAVAAKETVGEAGEKDAAGFAIAGEQKLPAEARMRAQAELARATVQLAPKAAPHVGEVAAKPAPAANSAIYPVRPTPALRSGAAETRAPVVSEPAVRAAVSADERPAPAIGHSAPAEEAVRSMPAVPSQPPAIEAPKTLPLMQKSAEAPKPGETTPSPHPDRATIRVFSGALN